MEEVSPISEIEAIVEILAKVVNLTKRSIKDI
jgi:hypothetical protein